MDKIQTLEQENNALEAKVNSLEFLKAEMEEIKQVLDIEKVAYQDQSNK